jgi:hypothetical protein
MTVDAQAPGKRRRRIGVALTALVAVAAGVWAWVAATALLAGRPVPLAPPLPVPNGYDDVLRATRTIRASGTDLAKLDLANADEATLTAVVEANRESLALARRGLDRPFQVPIVWNLDGLIERSVPELSEIRRGVALALDAEGRLAERQGRIDDAVRAYFDILRLGDATGRHVLMLPYLSSLAVQGPGLRGIRDVLGKLSAGQCRRLLAALLDQERSREPSAAVIRREHQFMDSNVRGMGSLKALMVSASGVLKMEKARAASTLNQSARRTEAARQLLLASLAVRLYRLENGNAPERLDALVPAILKAVPIDPYTGKPLIYRRLAGRERLYCAGPDGDDDALDPVLGRKHLETSNGDFTLDSL